MRHDELVYELMHASQQFIKTHFHDEVS